LDSAFIRKVLILTSYPVLIYVSIKHNNGFHPIYSSVGIVLFILSTLTAYRIHSLYPPKHDKPSDFPKLLTEGPYRFCRHPFYASLMINQLSIPLISSSAMGLLLFLSIIPFWMIVIKKEERELIEYWGEEYVNYMKKTPMLLPFKIVFKKRRNP